MGTWLIFHQLCELLIYWTLLLLSSILELSCRNKNTSQKVFFFGREALQWLSRLARGFLRPVTSLLAVQAMELVREIPPAVDYNETRPRSICDGNFLSDIVTNFLFRTSCGQRRSIVKELMFLFNLFFSWKYVFFFEQLCAFQSQFATSYFTTTTYSIGTVIPHFRVKKCSL